MSKRKKSEDLWNPADYDDEPRSNGNFGTPYWPLADGAAERAGRGEKPSVGEDQE